MVTLLTVRVYGTGWLQGGSHWRVVPPEDLLPDMRRLAPLLTLQQQQAQQQQLKPEPNTRLEQQDNIEQVQQLPLASAVREQPYEGHVCPRPTAATDLDAVLRRQLYDRWLYGVVLVPCWAALRGAFPLNGTYFQVGRRTRGYWRYVTRGTWHRGVSCITKAARASR